MRRYAKLAGRWHAMSDDDWAGVRAAIAGRVGYADDLGDDGKPMREVNRLSGGCTIGCCCIADLADRHIRIVLDCLEEGIAAAEDRQAGSDRALVDSVRSITVPKPACLAEGCRPEPPQPPKG